MDRKITIMIADDHPLFRSGLRQAFEEDGKMKVVGEVGDGTSAVKRIRKLTPDVAVLDIGMPGLNGLQVAAELHSTHPQVITIILSNYKDEEMLSEALDAGVRG